MKKLLLLIFVALSVVSCNKNKVEENKQTKEQVVNVYSHRHYDVDKEIFEAFTKETGIKVNVVKAEADELIPKLEAEGANTPCDLFITADAGRLYVAKEKNLLQAIKSTVLEQNIPANLRDKDNNWFGLTKRARVIVYSKERVKADAIKTYEDLTSPKWKKKVLCRPSSNLYNQSLLAGILADYNNDEAKAQKWVEGVVKNFARDPAGSDRDQVKAIAAGIGDLAIVNTYYIGVLLNSDKPEEVEAGKKVGIIFPNQADRGTHINVSGAGITKYSKNKDNAVKLLEYLVSDNAQKKFAEGNYEYPVKANVPVSELLKSWGTFKEDTLDMNMLGKNNAAALKIFDKGGWK